MKESWKVSALRIAQMFAISFGLMVGLGTIGCDKVETLVDEAKKEAGIQQPNVVAEAPKAAPEIATPAVTAPAQTGPSPEALLADLKGRSSQLIDDGLLDAISKNSDAAQQVLELDLTSNREVSGIGLTAISKFSNLKKLKINGAYKIEADSYGVLAALKMLTELDADATTITSQSLGAIASLTELRRLSLAHTNVQGPEFSQLKTLQHLEELQLEKTGIDDAALEPLASLPLRKLSVKASHIRGTSLRAFGAHPTLEELDISENSIPGSAFANAKFPELRKLVAARTQFGNDGVINAKRFPKLEELWLFEVGLVLDNQQQWDKRVDFKAFPALRVLHIGKNQFSDLGVARLIIGAKHLEHLYVNEQAAVTDRILTEFVKQKGLKHLDVTHTSVTRPRAQLLKKQLPDLTIVIDGVKLE